MIEIDVDLPLFRRGKVRDVYDLGESLLIVASDRLSAFDVALPTPIPLKGAILTRLSAFWFGMTRPIAPNHLITVDVDEMPAVVRRNARVAGRATLARKAQRIDVECVARGYLFGSAWADYRQTGKVFGRPMATGLRESDRLDPPIFTPTTKSDAGHDTPLVGAELAHLVGDDLARRLAEITLAVYAFARDHALSRGIILADTKLEFGLIGDELAIIDELLTPDSSRFWDASAYAPGRSPPSYDKQFVRDYLEATGWTKEPPAPELPTDVVAGTVGRYREAFRRITGQEFAQ